MYKDVPILTNCYELWPDDLSFILGSTMGLTLCCFLLDLVAGSVWYQPFRKHRKPE